MEKYIKLAKKLKALADIGVGGERENAEKMLNALMLKYSITISDIEGEKANDYYFNITPNDHKLWYQIVKVTNQDIKAYGSFPKKMIKEMGLGGNYMITCSPSEYIEIEAKYEFFNKLYKSELDIFYTAFLSANDLLCENPNAEAPEEITQDEIDRYLRVQGLSKNITKGQFAKQLNPL